MYCGYCLATSERLDRIVKVVFPKSESMFVWLKVCSLRGIWAGTICFQGGTWYSSLFTPDSEKFSKARISDMTRISSWQEFFGDKKMSSSMKRSLTHEKIEWSLLSNLRKTGQNSSKDCAELWLFLQNQIPCLMIEDMQLERCPSESQWYSFPRRHVIFWSGTPDDVKIPRH